MASRVASARNCSCQKFCNTEAREASRLSAAKRRRLRHLGQQYRPGLSFVSICACGASSAHVLGVAHAFKEGSEKGGKRRPFAIERENQIWPRETHESGWCLQVLVRPLRESWSRRPRYLAHTDRRRTFKSAICRKMRVDKKYSCRRYLSANRNICRLKKR